MKNLLKCLCVSVVFLSCKVRHTEGELVIKEREGKEKFSLEDKKNVATTLAFYEKILIPPTFSHLKISGKIDVNIPEASLPTLNSTIYIEQNQKIWINLNMLLLTVARGQITPSGVQAYIKTDKTYIDSDFEFLKKILNIDFIDYKVLEKLLMGRTFLRPNTREFQMKKLEEGYALVSIVPQPLGDKGNSYHIRLDYTEDYLLIKTELQSIKNNDALVVEYQNYTKVEENFLPKNVKIIIKGEKKGEILIENTKFEHQKMEAPFAIPKKYSKIDIQ